MHQSGVVQPAFPPDIAIDLDALVHR